MTASTGAVRCDPSLIEAARGGDADALVSLIATAQPDIRSYAARNCRAADIDDAVQETLLLLYRRVGTLRAVTSFSAWLFAVARRGFLFTGSVRGGERLAIAFTLVDNCLALGVDPERYLVDVIDKLERGFPLRRLSELIPANWAAEKAAEHRAE